MKKNKKNVAVLFTGGLDSTYLVYKNLKEGNYVYPIYVELKNNKKKTDNEMKNIKNLCSSFHKEFDNIHPFDVIASIELASEFRFPLSQLPIWLFAIAYYQLPVLHEIQIGYVMNDDVVSFIEDLKCIYKAYNKFSNKPLVPLKFPLLKTEKTKILEMLPDEYAKQVYSCEADNFNVVKELTPCGRCHTCLVYSKLAEESGFSGFPRLVNDKTVREIKKLRWKTYSEEEDKEQEYDERTFMKKKDFSISDEDENEDEKVTISKSGYPQKIRFDSVMENHEKDLSGIES